VWPHTEVTELHGDRMLEAITITNNQTGEQQVVKTHWLFLCLGGVPNTEWAGAAGIVQDEQNYLVTGPDLKRFGLSAAKWSLDREPFYLETSTPGSLWPAIFAADR
jgi:thioredoxin reductase (NADPH)